MLEFRMLNERRTIRTLALLCAWLALAAPAAAQTAHVAVIVGLSGNPEHAELFQRWASTLVDGATRLGVARESIVYLSEQPELDAKRTTGKSTKAEVERGIAALAKRAKDQDIVFIVLIGHGAFDGKIAKFNMPGPDMAAADFEPLLRGLRAQHVVFVNTTSSSAPFVAALAGPGRTVVTATRTGSEKFATLFGGYFIDALTSDGADADRNRRVSVLEAFDTARRDVVRAYEREGIMLTEHPLLDDSGDREGSTDPKAAGAKNGRIAAVVSLGSTASADPVPDDPTLRALHLERRDLERRVEALKLLKTSMESGRYASELEKLLIDLARKSKQIRDGGGKL